MLPSYVSVTLKYFGEKEIQGGVLRHADYKGKLTMRTLPGDVTVLTSQPKSW